MFWHWFIRIFLCWIHHGVECRQHFLGEPWQYNFGQAPSSNVGVAKCNAGLWGKNRSRRGGEGKEENEFTQIKYSQLRERVVFTFFESNVSGTFPCRTAEKESTIDIGTYQCVMHGKTPVRQQTDTQFTKQAMPSLFHQFNSYFTGMLFFLSSILSYCFLNPRWHLPYDDIKKVVRKIRFSQAKHKNVYENHEEILMVIMLCFINLTVHLSAL